MISLPIVAVDIGNARIKVGLFCGCSGEGLPEPEAVLALDGQRPEWGRLAGWVEGLGEPHLHWWMGSVNRPNTTRTLDWLRDRRPADPVALLAAGDLPLEVRLERPDMVGIDRLLAAVAANHLRAADRPAVVADLGTAITVDLVSSGGAFLGGAILPGIGMSARAMHEFTDLLPLVDMTELTDPPPALGTSTVGAMRSGLFWLAVGAIRELGARLSKELDREPEVFLTGGAGPAVATLIGPATRHEPHLTLGGIALTARAAQTS